ncbi:MAG: amidohydrolase [Gemmatimonadota bacterium]|nr:amidohydrolase [Gemmatimonadota bacterium]
MRFRASRPLLAVAWLATGCAPEAGGGLPADAVYVNGHVVTVDPEFSIAEAFAVHEGRFVAVGSVSEVRSRVARDAPEIDLEGRTVVPGFNDNHIHLGPDRGVQPWRSGMVPAVSPWTRGAANIEELLSALAERAAETPRGEWILGGLNRPDWPNAAVPTRWQLDEAAPEHPVMLTRGPHTYLLNSRALELAGIGPDTPDPEGGWIFRDESDRPNGRVLEAARRLVDRVLPPEAEPVGYEEGVENMRRMLRDLAGLGITSVNVAGVRPADLRQVQDLYARYGAELPRATIQIRLRPGHDAFDDMDLGVRTSIAELESLGFVTGFGDDRLKLGALKMSIDGGLSAPVFWSIDEYPGRPGFHGAVRIPAEVFRPVAARAHELGWQLGIHTIGDAAVRMVVDELARILDDNPRDDHRHYLHHVSVKPPAGTIAAMADYGIMVASQPSFTVGLGAYADEALDDEREATQNPTRSLLDAGVRVSHGSDSAPYGPLITVWTAVTRRGHDGEVYGPEEAVTVEEALRLHTVEPAYFTFDEGVKGSIAPGQLADFVVLSEDILSVTPERIRDIAVERVFIGGREVHKLENRSDS